MATNLYKRGRFYYYDFTYEGIRYNASTGCEYKSQANKVLRKKMAEVVDGKFKAPKRKHTTFEDLSEEFLEWSQDHRKGTFVRDTHSLKQLVPFFGRMWLENVTADDINRYMLKRRKDVSGSTVNREIQTLRRMFNLAISWNRTDYNPAKIDDVVYFPEPPKTHRWVRPDEINALFR